MPISVFGASRRKNMRALLHRLGRTRWVAAHRGPWSEDEVRIREGAHFRNVEPFEFDLCGHAVANQHIDDLEEDEERREDEQRARQRADALCRELARVAIEESLDRPWDAIPTVAIRAVGEQPERQDT